MNTPLKILVVEDSSDDAITLIRQLRNGGYDTTYQQVDTPSQMKTALQQESWDIIISDYNMPNFSAPAALKILQEAKLDIPFIILSGVIGENEAVSAMKAGAHDYIMKGNVARLLPAIERELHEAVLRKENRLLEAQFLQSQKMESVGRLAAGVAHDFNNLLTSIMGHSQLGATKIPPDHPLQDHFTEIIKASESASNLTRQLLAFSRKQVIEPKTIIINDIIENISNMLHRIIGSNIELTTFNNPNLISTTVDPGQIEQVILNLVVNARDAMPQGGRIVIQTDNINLQPPQARRYNNIAPGEYVLLSISDNGTGIPEEIKSKIFEPFFTTKEEGKGTGLGLATSYGIIKQSNGHIEVDSTLGAGTTFYIYLPKASLATNKTDREPPINQNEHATLANETILLAEDEPSVRSTIASMLNEQGYTVLQASNGAEAIDIAQQDQSQHIDLLLTDLLMPEINGVELANKFKHTYPNTKILLTSGYPDAVITRNTIKEKEFEFIHKPFLPTILSNKVREVLDK